MKIQHGIVLIQMMHLKTFGFYFVKLVVMGAQRSNSTAWYLGYKRVDDLIHCNDSDAESALCVAHTASLLRRSLLGPNSLNTGNVYEQER